MATHRTGSWTVEIEDGLVISARSSEPVYPTTDAHHELVIRAINSDLSVGAAPPDLATWGHEYKNPIGTSNAYYWLSYLSHTWHALDEGFTTERRRAEACTLREIIETLVANGTGGNRVRTRTRRAGFAQPTGAWR